MVSHVQRSVCGDAKWMALVLGVMPIAAFAQSAKPVNVVVVNDTTQPVPVAPQGTTQVAGTVQIGNTTSAPVPVLDAQHASDAPFTTSVSVLMDPGTGSAVTGLQLPAGKDFLVRYVSCSFSDEPASSQNSFFFQGDGIGVTYLKGINMQLSPGVDASAATKEMYLYVPQSVSVLQVFFERSDSTDTDQGVCVFSGLLMNAR